MIVTTIWSSLAIATDHSLQMGSAYGKRVQACRRKGIPVLAFIHEAPENIPFGKSELDLRSLQRLETFKAELKRARLVAGWRNVDDLKAKVLVALSRARKMHPRPGWIRGNAAASNTILAELAHAHRTIEELRRREKDLETILDVGQLTLPVVLVDYRLRSGLPGRLQLDLSTFLLNIGATLATPLSEWQFDSAVQHLVKKAEGLSEIPEMEASDLTRIKTLLLAKDIIAISIASDEFGESYRSLEITPSGRRVLAVLVEKSIKQQVAVLENGAERRGLLDFQTPLNA